MFAGTWFVVVEWGGVWVPKDLHVFPALQRRRIIVLVIAGSGEGAEFGYYIRNALRLFSLKLSYHLLYVASSCLPPHVVPAYVPLSEPPCLSHA